LREYDRALEIAPDYASARHNRKVLLRERGGGGGNTMPNGQ